MSTQQGQTRDYFSSAAQDWQNQSENAQGAYSVIEGRNAAVLDVVRRGGQRGRFLDVGCGTGQLVIAVAGLGWRAEGIDFAPSMIEQCEANAKAAGAAATFVSDSFFAVDFEPEAYDVISAQGFIEYVSPEEMDVFFQRAARMLRPGGALAVGSRNRLFNAFSMNDFTRQEAAFGTLGTLIAEATALQTSRSLDDALRELRRLARIDPQPDRHPITGIPVETRYQFSPAELSYRLRRAGLEARAFYPVHYQALPVSVKEDQPALHSEIAKAVAGIGLRDHRLVPQASSFVVEASRAGP
jgi:2-polyprenyl-3-methyl-5-hydroxy-6-metoxy-1,4-benzoquinol methylase